MAMGDYEKSLLNLSNEFAVMLLVAATALILVGWSRHHKTSDTVAHQSKKRRRQRSDPSPYRLRDTLLSASENAFYQVLLETVGSHATICPKVGLWDIFSVDDLSRNFSAKSRIDRKHVDFLLCEPESMSPLVGIELDDSSHNRPDRRERDAFVDAVYSSACFPLVHIRTERSYDTDQLARTLAPYLTDLSTVTPDIPPAAARGNEQRQPLCPKCGATMVVRVAKRGEHKGNKFYACPNYPECKSFIPIKENATID